GGNVRVVLVDVEAMHALAVSFDESHKLRLGTILHVVDAKAAVGVIVALAMAALELRIDEHQIADDARLVRVRRRMTRLESAENFWLARIGNVEDGRPLGPVLMADICVVAVDDDLSAAGELRSAQVTNVRRAARRRAAVTFRRS